MTKYNESDKILPNTVHDPVDMPIHTFEFGFKVDRKAYANAKSIRNWLGVLIMLYAFIAGLGFSTGVHVMKWLL
jgi:hypothetical protein